jgi:hypothetical protein
MHDRWNNAGGGGFDVLESLRLDTMFTERIAALKRGGTMRRVIITLCVAVAMTLAVGSAFAQDKGGERQEQKKEQKQSKKRKQIAFVPLGKNVNLEVTAKGDGGDLVAQVSTASNRFEANVERLDDRGLYFDGVVSIPEEGGGFLVSYNVHVSRRVKSVDGWGNVSFYIKGSALLKDGEERLLGKSGDYTVSLKVKGK